MYPHLLALHNLLRWIAIIAALVAAGFALTGWGGNKAADRRLLRYGAIFVITMDIQLLIGLILYFAVSPLTRMAFQNMSVAMKDHELRFFTVEHTTYMVVAVVLSHVGMVFARKGKTDRSKYRGAAIAWIFSLLLMLGGTPWWRPLLRFGS